MASLESRLQTLEQKPDTQALLPTIVADDTTEAELEAMRARGIDAHRMRDAVEFFV
jgi:hypothetical protein